MEKKVFQTEKEKKKSLQMPRGEEELGMFYLLKEGWCGWKMELKGDQGMSSQRQLEPGDPESFMS